jgi:hypothetical protein
VLIRNKMASIEQVIISSTRVDLIPHREAARRIIESAGLHALMMDHLNAESDDPEGDPQSVHASLALVNKADLYVGLIGQRYGYVPPECGLSMTELEYNRAEELRLPRLIFLIDDEHPMPKKFIEDGLGAAKLAAFKRRLQQRVVNGTFTTPDDLAAKLATALLDWRLARSPRALSAPDARRLSQLTSFLSERYAARVADWFQERFGLLAAAARQPALLSDDLNDLQVALPSVADEIEKVALRADFPGGFYVIDRAGLVIHQFVPLVAQMPNIRGYDVAHKDYFTRCRDEMRAIVSSSFTSANRAKEILVLAAPRVNDAGEFLGILDAVVDVRDSPFSDLAAEVASVFETDAATGRRLTLALVDERLIILGALDPARVGHALDSHPMVEALKKGKADAATGGYGAICQVNGTCFCTLAFWTERDIQ